MRGLVHDDVSAAKLLMAFVKLKVVDQYRTEDARRLISLLKGWNGDEY